MLFDVQETEHPNLKNAFFEPHLVSNDHKNECAKFDNCAWYDNLASFHENRTYGSRVIGS